MSYSSTIGIRKVQQKNLVHRYAPPFLGNLGYMDLIDYARNPVVFNFAKVNIGYQVPNFKSKDRSNLFSRCREPGYCGTTRGYKPQDMFKDASLVPELQQRSKGHREE